MNEGAAIRVLSFLRETNQRHLTNLVNEKRKVTVIGEENEPEPLLETADIPTGEYPILTSEQIQEFFEAAENGSIEQLEELFDSAENIDANMTRYAESLLMTAIRSKRPRIAEYLIDQLAINVNFGAELMEFRPHTRIPLRHRTLTCRELAYDRGMMDLVDLIDITSDEVRPSIKRYLQKRLQTRLDEIHQSYLQRLKQRANRQPAPVEEKEIPLIEEDIEDEQSDEITTIHTITETETSSEQIAPPLQTSTPAPPMPPAVARPYRSHIAATMEKIQASNEKSIDETGKKVFRFTNYTLRFRQTEESQPSEKISTPPRPRTTPLTLPNIQAANSPHPVSSQSARRPRTTLTTVTDCSQHSNGEVNTHPPVRETRTSICRSARHIATPRIASAVRAEYQPLPTSASKDQSKRLLSKRSKSLRRSFSFIPQPQENIFYSQSQQFAPVTLKSTAIGLPSHYRLIRD